MNVVVSLWWIANIPSIHQYSKLLNVPQRTCEAWAAWDFCALRQWLKFKILVKLRTDFKRIITLVGPLRSVPVDSLLPTCWTSDHRRVQNVQISEKLHHNQGMPNVCSDYPASRGFSLAWLLAFTKSFAWLVCSVVSFFNHATDKPRERLRKR